MTRNQVKVQFVLAVLLTSAAETLAARRINPSAGLVSAPKKSAGKFDLDKMINFAEKTWDCSGDEPPCPHCGHRVSPGSPQDPYGCAPWVAHCLVAGGYIPGLDHECGEANLFSAVEVHGKTYDLNIVSSKDQGVSCDAPDGCLLDLLGDLGWKATNKVKAGTVCAVVGGGGTQFGHVVLGVADGIVNQHNYAQHHVPISHYQINLCLEPPKEDDDDSSAVVVELGASDSLIATPDSECEACVVAMQAVFNLGIFNTEACADGVQQLIEVVCAFAGPYSSACAAFVDGVCNACRYVTKDHCNWKPLAKDACNDMGFCLSPPIDTTASLSTMEVDGAKCRTRDQVVDIAKQAAHGEYSTGVCGHNGHYRCDCSGLVSYAWGLGHGDGPDTAEFPEFCDRLPHWSDLQPGDALLKPGEHVLMFLHWIDEDKKTFKEAACHDEAEGCSVDITSKEHYSDFYPCRAKKQYVCPDPKVAEELFDMPPLN